MKTLPISLQTANEFVTKYHRHNKPTRGHKFSIGLYVQDTFLIGVAICGRPVSRHLDNGRNIEVLRLCTLGHYNACSKLYGAARRKASKAGFKKLITYTLETESGSSLRASGFVAVHVTKAEKWGRKNRPRIDDAPICRKIRWEILL